MATIRRVPSAEHNFQLVITRVYDEGDQELLEDSDESEYLADRHISKLISSPADEERTFLIGEELEFRTGETDGEPTFIWRDLRGDIDEFFEYVAQGTNRPTKAFFETCMYRAMYERKYKASADSLSDKQLEEFIWKYVAVYIRLSPMLNFADQKPGNLLLEGRRRRLPHSLLQRALNNRDPPKSKKFGRNCPLPSSHHRKQSCISG